MEIKLVITDLDRTFLRSDKTISRYSLSVIEAMRKKGIKFMLATAGLWLARPAASVKNFLPKLEFDYEVYHIGALADLCNGETVHHGIFASVAMGICQAILQDFPEKNCN